MTKFARDTDVSTGQSRADIEKLLVRYGADSFAYGWQDSSALVTFSINGRRVKFILPLPDRNAEEYRLTPGRKLERSPEQRAAAVEQASRSKWRALHLVIKAKLEAVESNITTFEDEFMAHIVLPNGDTVGGWMRPQIEQAYLEKKMPPLLPHFKK